MTSKPKEGDRSVDLTVAGEISSVTLRAPKIIRNDGNPYTNVVHVGAPNYGQKRVLSLSIVQAEFWIDYVVGCGSSTLHGSKPLPAADGELRLGFEVIVPPEHANKPWKVDGHPWFKGYFAAPGEHTVTLDGRPDCSFPKVSETSPGVEFPASCLAQVTQTPVPPPVITALVTARGEIVRSGFGDLALQGGARFRLGGAWSAAAQVGGLYSTSARGFVESASLHWDVVRPLTLGLTAEVVEASIDTVDHDSVWAFGFHPQLQARVALIAGFGAFVAPSWFWIFNEQVRMTSEASFFALGFGIDWRSR
ncbi:MAG TPA: hypothetical protein VFK05_03210 [Polyangiaceae bacterium]|nr:hypothetical protein [Polyangiaceae bacterium]